MPDQQNKLKKSDWIKVVLSVLAAFFGVQSRSNYKRDFSSNSYWPYIFAGLVLMLVFIASVYLLVRFALAYL